jgi:hypothetical protein
MARIDHDRQVAQLLHCRHDTQIERVSRMIGKRPYTALTEDHFVVSFRENVLRRHQKFFQRRRHAALQQYRLPSLARPLQQLIILHVPRADLDAVRVLLHQIERLHVDSFRYDSQARRVPRLRQQLQSFFSQPLE